MEKEKKKKVYNATCKGTEDRFAVVATSVREAKKIIARTVIKDYNVKYIDIRVKVSDFPAEEWEKRDRKDLEIDIGEVGKTVIQE